MKDIEGLPLSGANAAGLAAYQAAQAEFRRYTGDPLAHVDQALAAAPEMTMAHLFKAWLCLLGTEPAGNDVARICCAAAARLPADEREQLHLQAATLLSNGRWTDAGRVLEDLSLLYPRDLLALQAGHQIDFFTGDSRMLRDRIARALPAWQRGMPGLHTVLGMHAFGLEETGHYAQAEQQGRLCVELEPRDGWGWHAVAHVMEMRNDPGAGIEWLAPNAAQWAEGSFLAVHNWWHLALFQLELGRIDEVLRLYDDAIGGPGSTVMLDLVDASAMLWRLWLRGIDVGARWQALADRWEQAGVPGRYAFNDAHMMMAFIGADREHAQLRVIDAQNAALDGEGDNVLFTRQVGRSMVLGLRAYAMEDWRRCLHLLRGIRSSAHRFGGSHAQRDVIDLTLAAAARRAGRPELAAALAAERSWLRPRTAAAWAA
jgi:tetratricopeptide (TPR) repeat protein